MNFDRKEALGALGEKIVKNFLEHYERVKVDLSEDKYDMVKDMVADGETVEVKTLLPVYKFRSFCLPVKQSRKCESVDRLIFVQVPDMPEDGIVLYESFKDPETGRRYDFREYFNNEYCQFYRLTNLRELGKIDHKGLATKLWGLSPSNFKGYKNVFTA